MEVGAGAPLIDLNTTGNSPESTPDDSTTATDDISQNPYVQFEGGFLAGLAEGFVPFAGMGHQLLDAADVLDHGTPEARRGLAVGQILGGIFTLVGGVTGQVLGGAVRLCHRLPLNDDLAVLFHVDVLRWSALRVDDDARPLGDEARVLAGNARVVPERRPEVLDHDGVLQGASMRASSTPTWARTTSPWSRTTKPFSRARLRGRGACRCGSGR